MLNIKYIQTITKDNLILKGQLFSSVDLNKSRNTLSSRVAILHIHGMGGSLYYNGFYQQMVNNYTKQSYDFLIVEHRGTHSVTLFDTVNGDVRIIGNAYEIFEDSVLDIQAWIDKLLDFGYKNIIFQAHSLGPSKVLYWWFNTQDNMRAIIKALVLLSPVDMLGLAKKDNNYNKLLKEALNFVKQKKPDALLSLKLWGEYILSARTFLNFFENENSSANIFAYHNPCHAIWDKFKTIDIPVFVATGTRDVIDAPKEALSLLEKKLMNSHFVVTKIYEGAEHSYAKYEKILVRDILKFLKKLV